MSIKCYFAILFFNIIISSDIHFFIFKNYFNYYLSLIKIYWNEKIIKIIFKEFLNSTLVNETDDFYIFGIIIQILLFCFI